MPAEPTTVQEKKEHFHAKQDEFTKIVELAKDGDRYDFTRKSVLEKLGASDQHSAMALFRARNKELEDLGNELRDEEMKAIAEQAAKRNDDLRIPERGSPLHPADSRGERKTFGQLFAESKQFKQSVETRTSIPFRAEVGLKTLFETSAGFAPESVRSGLLVEGATRPILLTDLIPVFPLDQSAFVFMRESTRTHAAAEKAEGAAYAESTFVWEEVTSTARKITDSIPVTDEQLEDEMQMRSVLDQRLRFGLRQKLDAQVLVGSGTPPALEGVLNATGIQTQALGTDDRISAFSKALTKIRFTGRATPNGAVFHPNDWEAYVLLKNTNGDFLFGNPFNSGGPMSLLGIPVAVTDAETQNTGLVGDFANFSRIDDRRGVDVQIGYSGTQFVEGKSTIRADLRVAFSVLRPAAFCTITGI